MNYSATLMRGRVETMLKIKIRFEDCGIVGSDPNEFYKRDPGTGGYSRMPKSFFRANQVRGLLAVLMGERPVPANRMRGLADHWQSPEVRALLLKLSKNARIEVTEERCEFFFARKGEQVTSPNCNIDSRVGAMRRGERFVEFLREAVPGKRTHGDRVRAVVDSFNGEPGSDPSLYQKVRDMDAEVVREEIAAGVRKARPEDGPPATAWAITPGYLAANNFRQKDFVAIEVNGRRYNYPSSCGGPAYMLVRSGYIHLQVDPGDAGWLAAKLGRGAAVATFGEGGAAWVENLPVDARDFEAWDYPEGEAAVD